MGKLALGIIFLLALINLLAVFGPELGFDALWYHLTLPKLFLLKRQWYFPGGLLYYSAMPRLAETLFTSLLQLLGTTGPKLLQFLAGLTTAYLLYRLALIYFPRPLSLIGALLFYATWVVSWQSGSAYVDLLRTLFETVALFLALRARFRLTGIFLGLAIGTKWHALGSLFIYALVFSPAVILPALLVASPWFILSFHFTGNPLYPLFESFMTTTQLEQVPADFYQPLSIVYRLITSPISLARPLDDQLNPLIALLFIFGGAYIIIKRRRSFYPLFAVSLFGLFFWQLTPPPSTRYLLPYLPAITLISLNALRWRRLRRITYFLIFASTTLILFGRTYTNAKYLPFLLRRQSLPQFLVSQRSRLPDTFIDVDGFVADLPPDARILVSGYHNLFYFPRDFDHVTWADELKNYDYLVTNYPHIPLGKLIYSNSLPTYVYQLR